MPEDGRNHYYLGIVYDKMGERERAERSYRKAESLGHRVLTRAAGQF
jgi:Flp pilus assembly protein TadD